MPRFVAKLTIFTLIACSSFISLYTHPGGRALRPYPVVDTQGRRLASLFADISPDPRVVKSFPTFFPKPRACSASRSGLQGLSSQILNAIERPVYAQAGCGTSCAGQNMTGMNYPCGSGENCVSGNYLLVYEDIYDGVWYHGYMENGQWSCGNGCQCRNTICIMLGDPP